MLLQFLQILFALSWEVSFVWNLLSGTGEALGYVHTYQVTNALGKRIFLSSSSSVCKAELHQPNLQP